MDVCLKGKSVVVEANISYLESLAQMVLKNQSIIPLNNRKHQK